MKSILTILLFLTPTAVFAHSGHLVEAFGHDHWLGAAAIGAAIALGLWSSLKGSKKSDDEASADQEHEEAQEA
jgi:hypothetical protein